MNEISKQLDLLDERIDVEKVPILICTKILSEFLLNITHALYNNELISNDYYEYVVTALNYANKFFSEGAGDFEVLEDYQVKTWSLYKSYQKGSLNKNLMRTIVCCFYVVPELWETSDDKLELYFSLLLDVNPIYCKQFREFCEINLKAYAYETKDSK